MSFLHAISVLEEILNDLGTWCQTSNFEDFDADKALTKEKLESILYHIGKNDFDAAGTYLPFLRELREDYLNKEKYLEAIDIVIEELSSQG